MRCPYCGYAESKVIDSRPTDDSERIRRRRECLRCEKRFTTYEIVELSPVIVVKRNRTREPFEREKLMRGLMRACDKRPVSVSQLEQIVDHIDARLQNDLTREVSSEVIGEMALEALRDVDEVAYVRFASVYRRFRDIDSFLEELEALKGRHR